MPHHIYLLERWWRLQALLGISGGYEYLTLKQVEAGRLPGIATPGGKLTFVADCGFALPVVALTVASSSLSNTKTQPGKIVRTELCEGHK
jgi:hypothetical protein